MQSSKATLAVSRFIEARDAVTRLLLNRSLTESEATEEREISAWEYVGKVVSSVEFQLEVIDPLLDGRGINHNGSEWKTGKKLINVHAEIFGLSPDETKAITKAMSAATAIAAFFDVKSASVMKKNAEHAEWIGVLGKIVLDPECRICTLEDINNFYLLLLGRTPEFPLDHSRLSNIDDVAFSFFESQEFHNAVYKPLVAGDYISGLRFIDDPAESLCGWSSLAFPLTSGGQVQARSAVSWGGLYEAIFGDARLQEWFRRREASLNPISIANALQTRLHSFSSYRAAENTASRPEVNLSCINDRINDIRSDLNDRFRPRVRRIKQPIHDGPVISLIVPVYNTPLDPLVRMIDSVRGQTYPNWELCLADDGSSDLTVRALLDTFAQADQRIRIAKLPDNRGISAASNAALQLATGEYIALLDHDDAITCDALQVMCSAIVDHSPDILYSDECLIGVDGTPEELFAKPDWSPLLMCNMMYVSHFLMYRASFLKELGGFRKEFDFSQDYDLLLRASEKTNSIYHVEAFLYGWRKVQGSAAAGGKSHARRTNIAALQSAIDRRGWGGMVRQLSTANHVFRRSRHHPHVAIIVPSDNIKYIRSTIECIDKDTSYHNFDIRIVTRSSIASLLEEDSGFRQKVKIVLYDKPYNFSDKCNAGAAVGASDYVIFFNDDVRVISPDWIESLLEILTLPGVGAVGPKLLYENETIQHAGMVTGTRRLVGTAFHSLPATTHAHFNFAQCIREVSLLCGACLAMPTELFDNLGGFDAVNAPIAHSDVDLCLRIKEAGFSCVYTPHAELLHFGHLSIGEEAQKPKKIPTKDKADIYIMQRFGAALARDPFFTKTMVETLYHDSQEPFSYHPAVSQPVRCSDILLVSHDLSLSGAPKIILDMARVMLKHGRFVVVMSPSDGPMRVRLLQLGVHVIIEPLLFHRSAAVYDFVKNFDQVVANTIVGWPLVEQMSGIVPIWLYAHESSLVDHLAANHRSFVSALASAHGVWAGSSRSADALARHGIKSHIVPYGVDDISLTEKSSNSELSVVLLGSFEPRKGQDLAVLGAIEALRRGAKIRFDLYGRHLDAEFFKGVAERVGKSVKIKLHSEVPYELYKKVLYDADIVLVPSRDDTLPLVSLDALSASKALVCAETVGTSAFLSHKKNAWIAEGPSVGSIADALFTLAQDSKLRTKIGRGARRVFETNFTHEAFERNMIKALVIEPASIDQLPKMFGAGA